MVVMVLPEMFLSKIIRAVGLTCGVRGKFLKEDSPDEIGDPGLQGAKVPGPHRIFPVVRRPGDRLKSRSQVG